MRAPWDEVADQKQSQGTAAVKIANAIDARFYFYAGFFA